MVTPIDTNALEKSKSLLSLKNYANDGTLTYCDISKLSRLLADTQQTIDVAIKAGEKNNLQVLNKLNNYNDDSYIISAASRFYNYRNAYSRIYYYLTQMAKHPVYKIGSISLIPKKIPIERHEYAAGTDLDPMNIKKIFSEDNTDCDMAMDKLIITFYKYFNTAQFILNDADIFTYSYALLAATGNKINTQFYNFLKNIGFLYSMYVVFDRLFQLQDQLDQYKTDKVIIYGEQTKNVASSWATDPRKGNLEDIEQMLKETLYEYDRRLLDNIIQKHIDYLAIVKNLGRAMQ